MCSVFGMLLVMDIGNTSITLGLFAGRKLIRHWRMATKRANALTLRRALGKRQVEGVCVSSVVPGLNPILRKAIRECSGCRTLFVTAKNAGIKIPRYNKGQIGVDRLVNAVAAHEKYRKACIIIDFGTATTFDYVTSKGEYGGGVIAPGIGIINDALHERTAKLPRVRIGRTKRIVAQNTKDSIRSGVFHGYVGLVEHIVNKMKNEARGRPVVVATGGFASMLGRYIDAIDKIEPSLTLEGLGIIYKRTKLYSKRRRRRATPRRLLTW